MYLVVCRLFLFSPSHHDNNVGSYTCNLYSLNQDISWARACLSMWLERFRERKRKTIVGLWVYYFSMLYINHYSEVFCDKHMSVSNQLCQKNRQLLTRSLVPARSWNSWKYNFVEVSGNNLEISRTYEVEVSTLVFVFLQNALHEQTWVFFIDLFFVLISERGGMVFC